MTHVGVSKLDRIIFDNDISPDQPVCDPIGHKCVFRPRCFFLFFVFFFHNKKGIRLCCKFDHWKHISVNPHKKFSLNKIHLCIWNVPCRLAVIVPRPHRAEHKLHQVKGHTHESSLAISMYILIFGCPVFTSASQFSVQYCVSHTFYLA